MSNITVPEFYRRDPYSLDLWVPYVLIGSSCVTFLAVHFWCYHKRNRDRYLRQREEKQLKDGLMERRRIATLILARYQTDLGMNESNTEADLHKTDGDNGMECSGGHDEDSGHNQQFCADVIQEDESVPSTRDTVTAAEASSSHGCGNWEKTSVGNELETTTWPRVVDSRTFVDTAKLRQAQNNNGVNSDSLREFSTSAITNPENCTVDTCETSLDVINNRSAAGNRLPLLQVLNTSSPTGRTHRIPANISTHIGVPRQHTASRPPAPSVHSSNVFYTEISSATQIPGTSPFQSKHSKRRYNDSSVAERHTSSADQHRASLTLNQLRDYPPQESEEVLLTSFNNCGDGSTSDYGYTTSLITPTTKLKRYLGSSDLEAFHFEDSDQSAADTDLRTYALTAGHYTERETPRESQSALNTNRQSQGSRICQDKPVTPPQPDTQTNMDIGMEVETINSQSSTHKHVSRLDHAAADRPSVTLGKLSGTVGRNAKPQMRPGSRTTNEAYTSQAGSKMEPQTIPTHELDLQPTARPETRPPEQPRLPSESVSFLVQRSHSSGDTSGLPQEQQGQDVSEPETESRTRAAP